MKIRKVILTILFVSVAAFAHDAAAQSTLITIPSTDVVAEKNVYLEFDYISHYAHHRNGGFQSYVPRAAVGLGNNVEVGANVVYTDGHGVNEPKESELYINGALDQN